MVGQDYSFQRYIDPNWYRQRIVDQVHELYSDNNSQNLSLPKVIENNDVELVKAAITLFGSWDNVIYEAGIDLSNQQTDDDDLKHNEYMSTELVIDQLNILQRSKFDLSANFIKHTYPWLFYSSKNIQNFGGWSKALNEAEIDLKYLRTKMTNFWTISKIVNTLNDYEHSYGNIQPEFIKKLNPSLYSCSRRYYKTWSEIVSMSGLNLQQNLTKCFIEPLRTFILKEYVKLLMDLTGCEYRISSGYTPNQATDQQTRSDVYDLPDYHLIISKHSEILGGKTRRKRSFHYNKEKNSELVCVTGNYRSWGFSLTQNIHRLLKIYPKIIVYYSIGEPRRWLDESVEFINVNRFYSELARKGRDDIISDLSVLARSGIPKKYLTHYKNITNSMKELKMEKNKNKK